MRVLVCGGRDFDDPSFLDMTLDRLHREHGFSILIEGGARGANRLAGAWADVRGIAHEKYPADSEGLGRKAGPIRNEKMLGEGKPDLVVTFPGGRGTAHMTMIAKEAGVRVIDTGDTDGVDGHWRRRVHDESIGD